MNNDKGQGLMNKYVWVIETIHRHKKLSFRELNELWLNDDISMGVELPKRTFDNWRYAIWDIFGLNISNEQKGRYRYFIENEEDITGNGLSSWLYSTLSIANTLSGSQSIKERILLENIPSGQEYLQPIIDAMKANLQLNITYKSYWSDEECCFDVKPYCVKLFKQRWYMVAKSTHAYYNDKPPMIYSLDRILQLTVKQETFEMPADWNAQEYFEGCFGVCRSIDIELVRLKVSAKQANYIRDLKLHDTQEEVEHNDKFSIFTYRLRPEYDFQQELLRHGEDVEVLEPQWLREEIAGKAKLMWEKYESEKRMGE
ncbi:MAG: WYL domain-containing protein [Bacteroidaceae bacterium]|nr:WYL domain-containing protein [Bacteroidaceae bacterium]